MVAQPEVYAQVMLRQVASSAEDFAQLHQVAGRRSHACIQGQTIALCPCSLQLKTDPMVLRTAFGTKNHRAAHQVFDHHFHLSVVEKVTDGQPAADLRNLDCISSQLAGIPESSVVLVD